MLRRVVGAEAPLLFSAFITIYTMKDMKLIMESFQSATAKLVREGDRPEEGGLSKEDLLHFLDETPYEHPLPPFLQKAIDPKSAGHASRAMFIQHVQDQAQEGILATSMAELEDMYFDYSDFLEDMMDPESTSHLDDLGPVEKPAYNRDGKHFIPQLFQQLYDKFPGLENLLVHSARTGEVEGKALSPVAKAIMGVSPSALDSSPAHNRKKKACKPSKGKRFAKRVDGKCRSYGQSGKAKSGGDRIRPGTKKGDAYCARSAKIKKCKNPPCANTLSRKKWKCRGSKSMRS